MINKDQEFMVQKIRSQYTQQDPSNIDILKELDRKVKKPANCFAYTFGSLSALVMGAGMSLVMTDLGTILSLGDTKVPGIIIGIVGLVLALLTYPIYKGILKRRKAKFAPQILSLSEKILKS